jgi:hypothetical protein
MTAPTTTAAGDACHNAINAHAAQGAAAKVFNVSESGRSDNSLLSASQNSTNMKTINKQEIS